MCRPGAPWKCGSQDAIRCRPRDVTRFTAVVFGAGDFRTPTEHRPPPPVLQPGDKLQLGPLRAMRAARCSGIRA